MLLQDCPVPGALCRHTTHDAFDDGQVWEAWRCNSNGMSLAYEIRYIRLKKSGGQVGMIYNTAVDEDLLRYIRYIVKIYYIGTYM